MLTTMLNQNEAVNNYILELNLPYSSALKNHMVNLISGITVTEGSKNLSSIYSKLTCNRHRSTGSRFLGSYSWNHEYVTDERIFHAISKISDVSKDDDIGFLIIDDTLSKKDISTKHIEGLDFHNSHAISAVSILVIIFNNANIELVDKCVSAYTSLINEYSKDEESIEKKRMELIKEINENFKSFDIMLQKYLKLIKKNYFEYKSASHEVKRSIYICVILFIFFMVLTD